MKKLFAAAAGAVDGHDLIFVAGLALLTYGVYALYWPLAFIVPGAILTALGTYNAVQSSKVQGSTSDKNRG